MISKWAQYAVEEEAAPSKWDQYVKEEAPEQKIESTPAPQIPTFKDIISGKFPETAAKSLLRKKPSQAIRRPLAGILDLFESLSPSAPDPMQMLKQTPAEFARGDLSGLTPEELQSGESLELLTQLATPLPFPKGAKAPKAAAPKVAEAVEPGITKLKGAPKIPFIKPKAFPSSVKKAQGRLLEEGKSLIGKLEEEAIPISKSISQGKPVEHINKLLFEKVEKGAKTIQEKVPAKRMLDFLKKEKTRLSRAPVPSEQENKALKLISKFETEFQIRKDLTAEQTLRQFRSNNKNLKDIFETRLVKGSQEESTKVLQGLNNTIGETLEKDLPGNEGFKELFKRSNKEFSEIKKFERLKNTLEPAFSDEGVLNSAKLDTIIKNPKKSIALRNSLGEEAFGRLKDINTDIQKTMEQIKDVDKLGITTGLKSGLVGYVGRLIGVPGIKSALAAKFGAELILGEIALKPKVTRDFRGLLQAIRKGKDPAIKAAAIKFSKSSNLKDKEE